MHLYLIVGSESGNAEMVGDCVVDALHELGHEVERYTGGGTKAARLGERQVALVICSTTGIGDLPQNVAPLHAELASERPALGHLRYGIVGLGDRNYKESYLGGPRKWDALLTELGAHRVGDRLDLDATDHPTPDLDAVAWVKQWVTTLG